MAKKQAIDQDIADVKKGIEEGRAIIGTDRTLGELKRGNVSAVYLSSNCPADARADAENYAGLAGAKVIVLAYPSDEFATLCKKPFAISVIGIRKE